jgi:homoserine dehydrogenase
VVSDLIDIARDLTTGQLSAKKISGFLDSQDLEISVSQQPVGLYLRLTVKDQRGIVARIAEVIAQHNINIDSLEQEPHMPKDRVSFVITVEPVSESIIRAAVDAINAFELMVEPVLLLRVECLRDLEKLRPASGSSPETTRSVTSLNCDPTIE